MGNGESQPRRDSATAAVLAQMNDTEQQRLDLRSKGLYDIPEEITQLSKLIWLNLPNNHLTNLPDCLFTLTNLKTLRLLGNRLSSLPPGIKSLKLLSSLDLSKNDFVDIGPEIGELTGLTDLNFHWNIIETISPELSKLTNMKTLNISLNAITELPNIENFHCLESLDLSHNRLTDIPGSVKNLTRLNSLNLAGNRVIAISGSHLPGLIALRTLDLQGNSIKSLPSELGTLTSLKYLRLRANELHQLPNTCSQLVNLIELSLSQNFLLDLPTGLGALQQLQSLALYRNLLTSVSAEIGQLVRESPSFFSSLIIQTSLRELGLGWNTLTSVPSTVATLPDVAMVSINHNELDVLPDDFFSFEKVQELTIHNNNFKRLPKLPGNLKDLRKIDACSNQLEELPDLSALPNISWAEFGNNCLTSLPQSLFNTTNLQVLNLFSNSLTSIPAEFSQLARLKKLYLSYNRLDDESLPHPSSFAALTELEELFLDGNLFTKFPTALGSLQALTELGFSNNRVADVDAQILKGLTTLKKLHLTSNHISDLPSEFGLLSNLVELDLAHNDLSVLPDEFGQLINLTDLDISDNYIQEFPTSFTSNCLDMRQLKISFNAFRREPEFAHSADHSKDRVWISAAANGYVPSTPPLLHARSRSNKTKGSKNSLQTLEEGERRSELDSNLPRADEYEGWNQCHVLIIRKKSERHHRKILGWAELCGRRPEMQDTLTFALNFRGDRNRAYVAVFDGHAGEKSAELSCQLYSIAEPCLIDRVSGVFQYRLEAAEAGRILPDDAEEAAKRQRVFEERPKLRRGKQRLDVLYDDFHLPPPESGKGKKGRGKEKEDIKTGEGKKLDHRHRSQSVNLVKDLTKPVSEEAYIRVITGTFRELHQHITRRKLADGTAALMMAVEHDHKRLIIGNAGDERAVLARGSLAVQLTTDHKPEEPAEKVRIYDCGGFVNEQKRVDGILSLSRALGDNDLQPHVTYEPDVYFVDLAPEDRFVILACDGLWDVVSNQQAVDIASRYDEPHRAATALRDYAHLLNSSDNISVIVYRLDNKVVNSRHILGASSSPTTFTRSGEGASSAPTLSMPLRSSAEPESSLLASSTSSSTHSAPKNDFLPTLTSGLNGNNEVNGSNTDSLIQNGDNDSGDIKAQSINTNNSPSTAPTEQSSHPTLSSGTTSALQASRSNESLLSNSLPVLTASSPPVLLPSNNSDDESNLSTTIFVHGVDPASTPPFFSVTPPSTATPNPQGSRKTSDGSPGSNRRRHRKHEDDDRKRRKSNTHLSQ